MTRRERLERKLELRREWADKRRTDAQSRFAASDAIVGQIPMGQPILIGHHSEKGHRAALERSHNHMDKGCESLSMATHHESKADGIERQLDSCIFSDDDDANEQIEARIAELEAVQASMKAVNAAHKKFLANPASLDAAALSDAVKEKIRNYKPAYSWEPHPFPPYRMSNNNANIRRLRERLKHIKVRAERSEKAEANGGIVIEGNGEYVRITFADKPTRDVLNALKSAGFRWGGGSWCGARAKLPECVGRNPDDLQERFAGSHQDFQAKITAVANANGKTPLDVYALWRKYSADCQSGDQSAIFSEFLSWYRNDLPILPEGYNRLGA